jgi:hypothetical protein
LTSAFQFPSSRSRSRRLSVALLQALRLTRPE